MRILLAAAALLAFGELFAKVIVASPFRDNMVIQREMNVPVWGNADPGERVTVEFSGKKISCQADKNGRWQISLPPMAACRNAQNMTISGADSRIVVKNILIGEVWLCSGQSNMQMPMWSKRPNWRAADGDKDAAAGANPLIRIVTMRCAWSALPKSREAVRWQELDPENGKSFSAAAFYFGQELFRELDVPIRLVVSCWGGTRVEPWTNPEGFNSVPQLKDIAFKVNSKLPGTPEYRSASKKVLDAYTRYAAELRAAAEAGKALPAPPAFPDELKPASNNQAPTVLYNQMINPLVPMAVRGVIWYQGCTNRRDGEIYRYKMQALLNGWRKAFGQPEMPFYFVQLAPYTYTGEKPHQLPVIWEAQEIFARENRNVKMAVINDIGDLKDIHPRNKKDVGKRLAALAFKYTYGKSGIKADSPQLKTWKIEGDSLVLSFDFVQTWSRREGVAGFEISDKDGKWFPAEVEIRGSQLIIRAPGCGRISALRYMWHHSSEGKFFNEAGLPLGAFRITI